ncbi:MAG: peptidase M42 [Verrucomicrobia bacterium GWF2_51_19]|nr:MAG: peptidase M42 [Verrucomicrobia bacterium GWF2_51_19]HCJ11803.1 peptidase M42 [Opitutae bacterium]
MEKKTTKKPTKKSVSLTPSPFLKDLVEARSPSGFESEVHRVLDSYVAPKVDAYEKDTMGNRLSSINEKGAPVVMLAGHMDELGLMVHYVDDKGFVYFDVIGGHDMTLISGRRVTILAEKGPITGVTGKRAVHLMTPEDRKKVPERHQMWVDIGVSSKKEALALVSIGDPIVYNVGFESLRNNIVVGRAFDDKAGCYVVNEVLCRLAKQKKALAAKVVSVSTVQEEIGVRGAIPTAYAVKPDVGIAIDVTHATDHPDCDNHKFGEVKLGKGPVISRGANINPIVFKRLKDCADKLKIPYQVEGAPGVTGTDARAIQIARKGVAAALISIPLRYMHTPCEMVHLEDLENTIKLLTEFILSLKRTDTFTW